MRNGVEEKPLTLVRTIRTKDMYEELFQKSRFEVISTQLVVQEGEQQTYQSYLFALRPMV